MDICGKDALWIPEGNCECPDGGPVMQKVLYSQLVALKNANMLEPGTLYRIIDYVGSTAQSGTRAVAHPFDIVVTADDENTLSENARAMLREGDTYYGDVESWELKYSLENDTSRFGWASPNGKGVIYYMKDEYGNEAPYDFKEIQFARYQIDTADGHSYFQEMWATPAAAAEFADTMTLGGTPTYFFTFSHYDDGTVSDLSVSQTADCFENSLRSYRIEVGYTDFGIEQLPDIVFVEDPQWYSPYDEHQHGVTKNTIGANSHDLTFHGMTHNNDIDESVRDSVFLMSFVDNTIGDYCYGLFIGHQANDNTIGASCHTFIWDGVHSANVVGPWCSDLMFAPVVSDNTFDSDCYYISLAGYSCQNMFHAMCASITLNNTAGRNTFEPMCMYIEAYGGVGDCNFGNSCSNITLDGLYFTTFGSYCHNIELPYAQYLTFEDGVQFVRITNANPGSGRTVQNYYFLTGTKGAANNYIEESLDPNLNYTTYVARMTDGTLRLWNPADIVSSGGPVVVTAAADMTDPGQIYIYKGSEAGYVNGNWYYYNGSSWVSGGTYGTNINIDPSLTRSGEAADAKATGDAITELKDETDLLADTIPNTVQTYTFADGAVSLVTHKRGTTTIRSDTYTYGSNTITEVRTLNTGESLTIITDLTTLATTVTYAEA